MVPTTARQAVARAVVTGDVISNVKILDCGASYTIQHQQYHLQILTTQQMSQYKHTLEMVY